LTHVAPCQDTPQAAIFHHLRASWIGLLVGPTIDEVAFEAEEVLQIGMDRGEFL